MLKNQRTLTKTRNNNQNSKINQTTRWVISRPSLTFRVATYCISCPTSWRKSNSSSSRILSNSSSLRKRMNSLRRLINLTWQILKILNKTTMIIKQLKMNSRKVIRRWSTNLIRTRSSSCKAASPQINYRKSHNSNSWKYPMKKMISSCRKRMIPSNLKKRHKLKLTGKKKVSIQNKRRLKLNKICKDWKKTKVKWTMKKWLLKKVLMSFSLSISTLSTFKRGNNFWITIRWHMRRKVVLLSFHIHLFLTLRNLSTMPLVDKESESCFLSGNYKGT